MPRDAARSRPRRDRRLAAAASVAAQRGRGVLRRGPLGRARRRAREGSDAAPRAGGRGDPRRGPAAGRSRARCGQRRRVPAVDVPELVLRRGRGVPHRQRRELPERPGRGRAAPRPRDRRASASRRLARRPGGGVHGHDRRWLPVQGHVPRAVAVRPPVLVQARRDLGLRDARGVRRARDPDRARARRRRDHGGRPVRPVRLPALPVPRRPGVDRAVRGARPSRWTSSSTPRSPPTPRCSRASPTT